MDLKAISELLCREIYDVNTINHVPLVTLVKLREILQSKNIKLTETEFYTLYDHIFAHRGILN